MVATRGRTFKRPWRRSCLSSKLKSSSAPIGRKDSWCFHAVGSSNAPLLGSTAAEGLPRIGRTSIATRWRSCGLPQSASCSENFVIPPDVFGQTLSPAVAEEMVTHVYLCVGAVGEFFDFVTDCFIASSVPIDIRTPSTRPCSLRRNLIGRAKYTEPARSLHETSSTPAWLLPERRVLHRYYRFPDRP